MYIKPLPHRCPDGPGPMDRHGHGPKSTALTRSDTMVGPCLGRYLGPAARHGHGTTLGQPDLNPLKLCPPNPNFSTQLSPLSTAAASLFQISSLLPSSRSPPHDLTTTTAGSASHRRRPLPSLLQSAAGCPSLPPHSYPPHHFAGL
jgi:hypothetical protein